MRPDWGSVVVAQSRALALGRALDELPGEGADLPDLDAPEIRTEPTGRAQPLVGPVFDDFPLVDTPWNSVYVVNAVLV